MEPSSKKQRTEDDRILTSEMLDRYPHIDRVSRAAMNNPNYRNELQKQIENLRQNVIPRLKLKYRKAVMEDVPISSPKYSAERYKIVRVEIDKRKQILNNAKEKLDEYLGLLDYYDNEGKKLDTISEMHESNITSYLKNREFGKLGKSKKGGIVRKKNKRRNKTNKKRNKKSDKKY